jgi:hypothetical protein
MLKRILPIFILLSVLAIIGCNNDVEKSVNPPYTDNEFFPSFVNINYELDGVLNLAGIQGVHPAFTSVFNKYTNITVPNGKQIHIVGQDGVSRTKLARARNIMKHYLTDFSGGQYGSNKGLIANAMADTGAVLLYFNTSADMEIAMADELGEFDFPWQDIYSDETVVVGDQNYIDNTIHDTSYEKVFHLVHDYGIDKVIPEYNNMINSAMEVAIQNGFWTPDQDKYEKWLLEGRLGKEYITKQIEVYYGLWAHEQAHLIYDVYRPYGREMLLYLDPYGYEAVQAFLPTYFTHEVYLDESFEGTFYLNSIYEYSHKSRYIKNLTLTGNNNTNVYGNQLNNVFTGNVGDNTFICGYPGMNNPDDMGVDTLRCLGSSDEYSLVYYTPEMWEIIDVWNITDSVLNRSGNDSLRSVEIIEFGGAYYDLRRDWY